MQHFSLGVLFCGLGLLLILAAFFAGSETALMSLNRYRLRHRAKAGNRGARLAEGLLAHPDRLIGLILLLSTIVNVVTPTLVGLITFRLGGDYLVAVGVVALTFVHFDLLRGRAQDLRCAASGASRPSGGVHLLSVALGCCIRSCGRPICSPTVYCACSASRRSKRLIL